MVMDINFPPEVSVKWVRLRRLPGGHRPKIGAPGADRTQVKPARASKASGALRGYTSKFTDEQ